ncbi:MAG TPA: prepilin-type N-terminal cleavage/methylation domain-containing protein [bacterium]|nr:prepilin-type N-terminal cleavage/methylation domain-containing protein [bacterium]HQO34183.1 prepilin-type N-terminal cleavage/methylation domain-containing protein [bacterium]HQP97251.1 prepilin-type N-terminal cleavage/methylation domain-containing protein [bacterium]
MKENQKKAAFTLIELLIVVAIIGILAAIAVPNFMNARMRASVSRAQSDLRNLSVALESYRLDNNHYPPASLEGGTSRITVFQRWAKLTTPTSYMASVPFDPFFTRDAEIPTAWGGPVYEYFEREMSQLSTSKWGPTSMEMNALYFIKSFGPDKVNSAATVSGYYTHIVYDLSNGVTSLGDIVRYGP